ncbi:hypothetical protein ABZX51_003823 [Aspergillus tubingensis]
MADPLSIAASVLAVITAAVQSTKSLQGTVKRFRNRDKTLRLLQNELDDLTNILESLQQVTNNERSILALLQGHIDWCNQICSEIEQSIKVFSGKSKTGLLDWAKMELMRGDISEFIDTIAGYKSTISDTAYNLEIHLRRNDEKLARLTTEEINASDIKPNFDAKSYIESLEIRESSILSDSFGSATEDDMQNMFEAQFLTRQALKKNRDSFADIIGHLQKRLESSFER